MGNLISYLKWRGDLDFQEREFCDADNLVLSALAYVDFSGIVPEDEQKEGVTLAEAEKIYRLRKEQRKKEDTKAEEVLFAMAETKRYGDAVLSCYTERVEDSKELPFAALRIRLSDGSYYLAFRGTDDSLAGWREEMASCFQVVPAQFNAVKFLEKAIDEEREAIYRVGGHSKGGNLAVYASMMVDEKKQEKITAIYNNDGPGLSPELKNQEKYEKIKGKILHILPPLSVMGRLFAEEEGDVLVQSSEQGLLQHDILTWQLEGDKLCLAEKVSGRGDFYYQIFKSELEDGGGQKREDFMTNFFLALGANGASEIRQVDEDGFDGFSTVLLSVAESRSRRKIMAKKFLIALSKNIRKVDWKACLTSRDGLISLASVISGVIFLVMPSLAVQSIGITLAGLGFLWSAKKIIDVAMEEGMVRKQKKQKLVFYIALLSVLLFLATHKNLLVISGSMLLGILFLFWSFYLLQQSMQEKKTGIKKYGLLFCGIVLFLTGCVSLTTSEKALAAKMLLIGGFLIIYGIGTMMLQIYHSGGEDECD